MRLALWTLKPAVVIDIGECFRSKTALVQRLDTNPQTWSKIRKGGVVRREVARGIVENFLTFIDRVRRHEESLDHGRHSEIAVGDAIRRYAPGGVIVRYTDLIYQPPIEEPPEPFAE
jgi:hypothetical protein